MIDAGKFTLATFLYPVLHQRHVELTLCDLPSRHAI